MRYWITTVALMAMAGCAFAQAPPADELKAYVHAQFGPKFTPAPMPGSTTVLLTGDFDSDGAEDALIVAQAKDPLADQARFNYRAIDPLDAYYGWGDVHDTARFLSAEPERTRVLLLVHNWRAATPKLKFAIINVSFSSLAIESTTLKKKQRTAIAATEQGAFKSLFFWDGKRWRFEPGDTD